MNNKNRGDSDHGFDAMLKMAVQLSCGPPLTRPHQIAARRPICCKALLEMTEEEEEERGPALLKGVGSS